MGSSNNNNLQTSTSPTSPDSAASSNRLDQMTNDISSLSPNDIKLNVLNPTGLYPIPSDDDIKMLTKQIPDLTLSATQSRLLYIKKIKNLI